MVVVTGFAMDEIVADVFTWAWFSEPHGYDFQRLSGSSRGRKPLH